MKTHTIPRVLLWLLLVTALVPALAQAGERGVAGPFLRSSRVNLANLPPLDAKVARRTPAAPRELDRDALERQAQPPAHRTPQPSAGKWPRALGETSEAGPPAKVTTLFAAQARSDYPIGPPDTTGAVGKDRLITGTNIAISVHDRTGKTLQTVDINDFWAPLAGDQSYCGDPRFVYDPLADRFYSVVMALGYQDHAVRLLLAHTVTGDPGGEWRQVELPLPATHSIDQPLLGFSANRVVVQANDYVGPLDKPTGAAVRTRIISIDKADLLAGGTGKTTSWAQQAMGLSNAPAQTWDPQVTDSYLISSTGNAAMRMLRISGELGADELSTVATWSTDAKGSLYLAESNVGAQLGSDVGIDVGDGRTHDTVLRNGTLWFAFSLFQHKPGPDRGTVVWQQVSLTGEVLQDGQISGEVSLSHPSVAVDAKGNVLVGFSKMTTDGFASAAFAYHRADMPPGTTLPIQTTLAGRGLYDLPFEPWGNRWGDYSATVIDPQNDHLWTLQEFANAPDDNGQGLWGVAWAEVTPAPGTCASDSDCAGLQFCDAGVCAPDLIPGSPCGSVATCATGLCLQGVCCAEACSGNCKRCLNLSVAQAGVTPGLCVAAPPKTTCDDGDPCTLASSCIGSKCVKVGVVCDDGNPCTADVCGKGGCSHTAIAVPCSDGSACTVADQCIAGACKPGPARNCSPSADLCQATGSCHPIKGCEFTAAADGTACGDGTCSGGECVAGLGGRSASGCSGGQGSTSPAAALSLLALAWLLVRRRRAQNKA